jgi:hypothetical protein
VKKRRLIFTLTVIGVLILGFLGYSLISNLGSGNDLKKIQGKYAMSEKELRDIVKTKHLTAYWAGPVAGDKYSLNIGAAGQTFVRYLPAGQGLTATGSTFRIIATYSLKGAFLTTQTAGTQPGNVGFTNVDGNSVFYVKSRPTNVYMGMKGKDIQLEIFDPAIDQALALALFHGQIQLIS